MKPSYLHLKDGTKFAGTSPDWQTGEFQGEVVFNTGMCGYELSLTDPSYAGQILVFTYPLIGNYGVSDKKEWESNKVQAAGVVVSECCENWSHTKGEKSLSHLLEEEKIPLITGVDTRSLTKILRESGVMLGAISDTAQLKNPLRDPNEGHLVSQVSIDKRQKYGSGKKKIAAIDCGMKRNILRCFERYDATVHVVPYNDSLEDMDFDGIFISNGPGNPEKCKETIATLKKHLKNEKPIFGICLGAQILALAAGAKTYKLRYGHRGHNQPCKHHETNQLYMTSQNHGYAISEKSLPKGWEVIYSNLNDNTVEGIRHTSQPFYAVQFHPEAAPGPKDTESIFEEFIDQL